MCNQQKLEGVKHQPTISQSKTDHVSQMTQPWWHAVEGCSEFRPFKHMNHSLSSRKRVIRRIYSEEFLPGSHWEAAWVSGFMLYHIYLFKKKMFPCCRWCVHHHFQVSNGSIYAGTWNLPIPKGHRTPKSPPRKSARWHRCLSRRICILHPFHGSMDWFSRENVHRKPHDLNGKIDGFRFQFFLKPIHWMGHSSWMEDGGSPIAGWFMESKPTMILDDFLWGYSHDLGHLEPRKKSPEMGKSVK